MAIPVLAIWIAAAVAAGTITVAAGLTVKKWLTLQRTAAFIGRPGSGKTSLAHFLEHGVLLPQEASAPSTGQSTGEGRVDGLKIFVVDSAGDRLNQWERGVRKATGVVYFFDASLVAKGDHEALSALAADAEHLGYFLGPSSLSRERRVTLLGTHADLFESKTDEKRVRTSWEIQSLRNTCDLSDDDVVIGSLADVRSAGRLAAKVAKRQMKG